MNLFRVLNGHTDMSKFTLICFSLHTEVVEFIRHDEYRG